MDVKEVKEISSKLLHAFLQNMNDESFEQWLARVVDRADWHLMGLGSNCKLDVRCDLQRRCTHTLQLVRQGEMPEVAVALAMAEDYA